ncbi:MAG: hypothetical protein ACLSA6_10090 [Holdemania massiliensis]
MFPQLIAGPIVRYKDIAEQLDHRKETADQFVQGIQRFVCGLAKKCCWPTRSAVCGIHCQLCRKVR